MAVKLSGVAVLLVVVVPLCTYACALLVGVQLGRALERRQQDTASNNNIGVLRFVAKGVWDAALGREGKHPYTEWVVAPLVESSATPMAPQRCNRNPDQQLQRQLFLQRQRMLRQAQQRAIPPVSQQSPCPPDDVSRQRRVGRSSALQSDHPYTRRASLPPESRNGTSLRPRGVISVGPWGGSGGQPFYMHGPSAPRLRSITLYHSPGVIHSLACDYSLAVAGDGAYYRRAGPWGRPRTFGSAGRLLRATVELSAGEHVVAVEGTTGHFADVPGDVVTSLTFRTSSGRTYGPYGGGNNKAGRGTTAFSVPVADGACIAGFWGRSGRLLDAVGVYVRPCNKYPAYSRRTRHGSM